ncbi:MAG: leucyl/phenylalanyl-tRNA--protein transferase [Pirellulaceae bacterium]
MSRPAIRQLWSNRLRPFLGRAKYLCGIPFRKLQDLTTYPVSWLMGGPTPAIARLHRLYELTPERVLAGYVQGVFPTGEPGGRVVWHCPAERAVIATGQVHVSRRLKGYLNKQRFDIEFDRRFSEVIQSCADRQKTWITDDIAHVYQSLHERGFAHSVEALLDGQLAGGGYGVALGNVFFLESMFCREDHASKIAFVHLAERLQECGFRFIDCQFMTGHWERFGARPVPRNDFQVIVAGSLNRPACFSPLSTGGNGLGVAGMLPSWEPAASCTS